MKWFCNNMSRPDPERSTRGNRRVPLSGSQFLETHSKTRKAQDILTRLNNDKLPFLSGKLTLKIN